MMKRWLAALLCLMMLWTGVAAADPAMRYRYTFTPGSILSGEGMEIVEELTSALRIELYSQKLEDQNLGQVVLESEGKNAFSIRVRERADGTYGLACSLLGDCTLVCRKDQLDDVIMTLVQMLADKGILKGESLEKISAFALKLGSMVEQVTSSTGIGAPESGVDLSQYTEKITSYATETQEQQLDGTEYGGAVKVTSYLLSEEDMNRLVDQGLQKVCSVPVLSDELKSGNLYIGNQVITDTFIRDLFRGMHGKTTLLLYENAEGKLTQIDFQIPDISGLVYDPEFGKLTGLRITMDRSTREDGTAVTLTTLWLTGLDGELMSILLEKGPGKDIPLLSDKKVYQVGELNSVELWEMLHGLWLTILKNAANMILDLPRVVFDMLVDKLF